MKIKEIINYLEEWAPPALQESYDNSGLLVGDQQSEVAKVLVSLDVTEDIIDEALERGANLIVAHHPLVFSGIKSLTGKNYVERAIIKAIKNDIAIYAIHTNLDNVATGVNHKIGEKLGINNPQILAPKKGHLNKLSVFVPKAHIDEVANALFEAGAGHIGNYDECSFQTSGKGTFRGGADTDPHVGGKGLRHAEEEVKLETIIPSYKMSSVVKALLEVHPYEEVAYDIYPLENMQDNVGSGMWGVLEKPAYTLDFLKKIKDTFGGTVRYTSVVKDQVQKIVWCGGSGSFLLPNAKSIGADVFITSDFKYHQFFDAEEHIVIADIGHFENEQYTSELITEKLKEKFTSFAVLLTETNTNPINYL